tara:strand:- start:35128 stop:35286 length:159 start_codon:yes stop_codon:yes gene_type:complete
MKRRLFKIISIPFAFIAFIPAIIIYSIKWIIDGKGTIPDNTVIRYFNWLEQK